MKNMKTCALFFLCAVVYLTRCTELNDDLNVPVAKLNTEKKITLVRVPLKKSTLLFGGLIKDAKGRQLSKNGALEESEKSLNSNSTKLLVQRNDSIQDGQQDRLVNRTSPSNQAFSENAHSGLEDRANKTDSVSIKNVTSHQIPVGRASISDQNVKDKTVTLLNSSYIENKQLSDKNSSLQHVQGRQQGSSQSKMLQNVTLAKNVSVTADIADNKLVNNRTQQVSENNGQVNNASRLLPDNSDRITTKTKPKQSDFPTSILYRTKTETNKGHEPPYKLVTTVTPRGRPMYRSDSSVGPLQSTPYYRSRSTLRPYGSTPYRMDLKVGTEGKITDIPMASVPDLTTPYSDIDAFESADTDYPVDSNGDYLVHWEKEDKDTGTDKNLLDDLDDDDDYDTKDDINLNVDEDLDEENDETFIKDDFEETPNNKIGNDKEDDGDFKEEDMDLNSVADKTGDFWDEPTFNKKPLIKDKFVTKKYTSPFAEEMKMMGFYSWVLFVTVLLLIMFVFFTQQKHYKCGLFSGYRWRQRSHSGGSCSAEEGKSLMKNVYT